MSTIARIQLSWTDADGNPYVDPGRIITCPGMTLSGCLPVSAGAASGTEYDVPFTGQLQGACLVFLENETGQELNAAWVGNWAPHIPAGGVLLYAFPGVPAGGAMTALRFILTQQQAAAGKINYVVCGC